METAISPSVPLYSLAFALRRLLDTIAEQEGEVTPEQEAELTALNLATDDKVEAWGLVIREREAAAEALRNHAVVLEAKRLTERASALDREAEKLRGKLIGYMEACGVGSVKGTLLTVRVQANPLAVAAIHLTEEEIAARKDTPEWRPFVREVPARVMADNRALITASKAGQPIPKEVVLARGARLVLK